MRNFLKWLALAEGVDLPLPSCLRAFGVALSNSVRNLTLLLTAFEVKGIVETTAPAPARKGQVFVRLNQAAETVAEADGSKKRVGATKTLEASSADLVASVNTRVRRILIYTLFLFHLFKTPKTSELNVWNSTHSKRP